MHESKAAKKMFSIFMILLLLVPLIFPQQAAAQTAGTSDLTFDEEVKLEKVKEKDIELEKQPNNDNKVNEYKIPS
ncbi:hypothetical protein J4G37_55485, partial [Microvirga sp. 3-52]|nr:hypothetical protein [Microvirga sp. 3-52]